MSFDIDIDVPSGLDKTKFGTRAMIYNEDTQKISPHPSGVYLEEVPVDPVTGLAAFPYDDECAKDLAKIDLLNNSVYSGFKNKQEVLDCLHREPKWSDLANPQIVSELPHIANHYDLVAKVSPESIEELADVLALIRPAKKHLVGEYLKNPKLVRRNLYKRDPNGKHYFKKSHAISYAMMVVVALNRRRVKGGLVW